MEALKKQKKRKSVSDKKFVIKNTGKYGKGVFAKKDIKKGSIVHVLDGKKMTLADFIKKVNSGKEDIDDPFQIGRRSYIDLDTLSRLFNHSCDPNCGIRKKSEMFAIKDIKKGDEITYDYSVVIAPTVWKMRCKCGSVKCRKTLGDVRSVPKKQLAVYKKLGALQGYMKVLLREIEVGRYKIPKYEIQALKKLKNTHHAVSKG